MKITLTIYEEDGTVLSPQQKKTISFLSDREYSIGRSNTKKVNDWDLIDPSNEISRHHATIFFKDNKFFIRDNSTAGIEIYPSKEDNEPKPVLGEAFLDNGMSLGIGIYEIDVAISSTSEPVHNSTSEPVHNSTSEPVHNSTSEPVHNSTSKPVQNFTSEPVHNSTSKPVQNFTSEPAYNPFPESENSTPKIEFSNNDFLLPFLEGLGFTLSAEEIHKLNSDNIKMLGKSFRGTIEGMIKLYRMRDKIKAGLDLDDTVFHSNNILKKANDAKIALKMVITTPQNYTPLDKSVTEVYENIDELLYIMMKLPRSSARNVCEALSPTEIEYEVEEINSKSGLFGKKNKWEVYCDFYEKLNVEDEIAEAYKEELAKYDQKKHHK